MAHFDSLDGWLGWLETQHPKKIDLGLERTARVAARLDLLKPAPVVISVAGTNGKGSCVHLLESIYRAAGYKTGSYTSPHLLRYNERVCLDGVAVTDQKLCDAFQVIDERRGETALTYFEFGTLAALQIFMAAKPDVVILEVGMGGRLDAVNIIDADVALVTRIGLDHCEWLGDDRETIGVEKAGIFRTGCPAICCDPAPPASLFATASSNNSCWMAAGSEFSFSESGDTWEWWCDDIRISGLPHPDRPGRHQLENAAGVLMAVQSLQARLPVSKEQLGRALVSTGLPGRCEFIMQDVETVLDVAHNPDSIRSLVNVLMATPSKGRTRVVLGMLEDKPVENCTRILSTVADNWYLGGLSVDRGLSIDTLKQRAGLLNPDCSKDIQTAFRHARKAAGANDRIVVCGSFYTVAEVMKGAV